MNKTIVGSLVGAALLAVMVLALAIPALRSTNSNPGSSVNPDASAHPSAQIQTLERKSGETAPLDVPQRPDCPVDPAVELPCLGGETTVPGARIQIYNVWAWWCAPCREELPLLEAVAKRNDWQLIGVHADTNAAFGANLLNELGLDMSSYQDYDNTFAGTLGLPGVIPITVVMVDGQEKGRIIKAFDSQEQAESDIKALLS